MYELKKIGNVFTRKFVGTRPSSCKKIIDRAAVSQRLRNAGVELRMSGTVPPFPSVPSWHGQHKLLQHLNFCCPSSQTQSKTGN